MVERRRFSVPVLDMKFVAFVKDDLLSSVKASVDKNTRRKNLFIFTANLLRVTHVGWGVQSDFTWSQTLHLSAINRNVCTPPTLQVRSDTWSWSFVNRIRSVRVRGMPKAHISSNKFQRLP